MSICAYRFLLPLFLGFAVSQGCFAPDPVLDADPEDGWCEPMLRGEEVNGRSIFCSRLVPVPELRLAAAVLELTPLQSPFGVAVTPDGRHRYGLLAHVIGLPAPEALGPYNEYVAWITDPALGDPQRLGVLSNGKSDLGEVSRNQFRILVSAEASGDVTERQGPLVLRGTSPSVGILAHRDMANSMGALGRERSMRDGEEESSWPMLPMPEGMVMMSNFMGRVPAVSPWRLSSVFDSEGVADALPRQIERLESGDTLILEAGVVKKQIGERIFLMYAYNGQVPGPLIEVDEGTRAYVAFTNRIDQPTTIHWHGLRLDNRFDGVATLTQSPVLPGERFDYQLDFPDPGAFWYHPHLREEVQQDLGLYGNMVVLPADSSDYGPVNRQEILTVDDFALGEDGPVPYGESETAWALMGRMGNTFLLNGRHDYRLAVRRGEVVRFFLTNVSNARTFNLRFGDLPMKLVASDLGRFERESWVESVVVAPAERYAVEVRFPETGSVTIENRVQAINHMTGVYTAEVDTVGVVEVADLRTAEDHRAAFEMLAEHRDVISEIDSFRPHFDRPIDHTIEILVRAEAGSAGVLSGMAASYAPPIEWSDGMPMMNWLSTGHDLSWLLRDPATGLENMEIDWSFHMGDVVKMRVVNRSDQIHPMNHPFHVHGQRFLVLSRNGVQNDNLAWKDTTIIQAGETVDLLVEMSNPGDWMAHCHIAEHLATGMMFGFEVQG